MPAKTFPQLALCQLFVLIIGLHQPTLSADLEADQVTTVLNCPADLSSLWEISSRHLGACVDEDVLSKLSYSKRDELACNWIPSSLSELLGTIQGRVLGNQATVVVYSHGNWNSVATARRRATMIFDQVRSRSSEPVVFVLYSWPSDRGKGVAKDIREKNRRLPVESHHLAKLLSELPSESRISLIGFSFGCPLICGALHLERGGSLAGYSLSNPVDRCEMYRLSLTAPAFDRCRLGPNGTYKYALGNVSRVVSLYNSTDPVLKRFRFVDENYDPVAAGYAGLPRYSYYCDSPGAAKICNPEITQYDCKSVVGRTHSEEEYICKSAAFQESISNLIRCNRVASESKCSNPDVQLDVPVQIEVSNSAD